MPAAPDLGAAALASTRQLADRFGYVEPRPVALRLLPDAVITARRYPRDGECLGAVYGADRRLLPSSVRVSAGDVVAIDPEVLPDAEMPGTRIPRALYGGIIFLILGHFLFETAARLWPLVDVLARRRDPEGSLPIVFHPSPGFNLDVFMNAPFLRRSLEALGIRRQDIVLAESGLRVDRLYYPDPLSIYHEYLHPMMGRVLDALADRLARRPLLARRAQPSRRVFLSRRRWPLNARIANEAALETLFQERGFAVLHPERLAPDQLIAQLRAATVLAASDGSHAHLAAFCRAGTRTLLIDTRPVPTQFAIERLRHLEAAHLPLYDFGDALWDAQSRIVSTARLAPVVDELLANTGS